MLKLKPVCVSNAAGWCARLEGCDGPSEVFDGFPTRDDAQRWIDSNAVRKWLEARVHLSELRNAGSKIVLFNVELHEQEVSKLKGRAVKRRGSTATRLRRRANRSAKRIAMAQQRAASSAPT